MRELFLRTVDLRGYNGAGGQVKVKRPALRVLLKVISASPCVQPRGFLLYAQHLRQKTRLDFQYMQATIHNADRTFTSVTTTCIRKCACVCVCAYDEYSVVICSADWASALYDFLIFPVENGREQNCKSTVQQRTTSIDTAVVELYISSISVNLTSHTVSVQSSV